MAQAPHSAPFRVVGLVLLLALCGALMGCGKAIDRLGEALYPSVTPAASEQTPEPSVEATALAADETPTQVVAADATFTPGSSTPLPMPPTLGSPTATPEDGPAYQLVYVRGGSIFRSAADGASAAEAAIAPQLEAGAFHNGLFASPQGRAIDLIDLNAGRLYSLLVNADAPVDYAEILWGTSGTSLLHIAWLDDASAASGRSVDLRALSVPDGAQIGLVHLVDPAGLTILRYDDALGRVALILHNADGAFGEVSYYELATGALVASLPVSGTGAATLSPDGGSLLVQQQDEGGSRLAVYGLNSEALPLVWDQSQEHSVSHVWSPDGRLVAFLLRTGLTDADPDSQSLGVWVLDTITMQATQVIEEASLSASLIGWTPDSTYMLGYHRGVGDDVYYYTIRPDGSDRRILSLPVDAEVLGWMSTLGSANVPQVIVDPWRSRFVGAAGDTQATADLVAEIVATQSEVDDQALLRQITDYLQQAGWQLDPVAPSLKRVEQTTFVVQLPPLAIYVISPQLAQSVASGHVVLDARLVGDDLGLVYGIMEDGRAQPTYRLLRRAEGTWQTLWSPQGQRDWITTDGEIAFASEGLDVLQVSGSSFGLDGGEDVPFSECRACPHRQLVANWQREGDQYVRPSQLPADAPLADVLWEITQRTPYGVLYECIRRLRLDLPVDSLVANAAVLAKFRELGLADPDLRLVADEELEDRISFSDVGGTRHFTALVQGGRVIHVEESD